MKVLDAKRTFSKATLYPLSYISNLVKLMKGTISRRNACLATIVGVCLAFFFGLKVNIHFLNKNSALDIENIDLYPNPILLEGKDVPRWNYTSMMFDYKSVSNLYSKYLKREQKEEPQTTNEVCESRQSACNGCKKCRIDQTSNKHPMMLLGSR